MRIVVTCGPGSEPIDAVRRITNYSTGELGILIANQLIRAGHQVICFKGFGATTELPLATGGELIEFTTNEDLDSRLREFAAREKISVLFHAAALCDFRVEAVTNVAGEEISVAKIPSRLDALTLSLAPAKKLLPGLKSIFPAAKIVGWKYELNGDREDALAAARRQLQTCKTNACIVNGVAYGPGFGFCMQGVAPKHLADKQALAAFLEDWLRSVEFNLSP